MKSILPIAAAALLLAPPAALAAPYRVYACSGPDHAPLSMHPFEPYEVPVPTMNHYDRCRGPESSAVFEWAPGMIPASQTGGWWLRAPEGTAFTQVRWTGSVSGAREPGAHVELDTDIGLVASWAGDLGEAARTFALPAGSSLIELRQTCRAALCAGPVQTSTSALSAELDDPEAPAATHVAGLPETAHGLAAVTFAAADRGSGLARAALTVDGTVRATALSCESLPGDAHGFQAVVPCPPAAPVELAFDSARVPDGAHVVSATLEDAAGNLETVYGPVTRMSDNSPPVAGQVTVARTGDTLTATPAGFDGQAVAYTYRWLRCAPECGGIESATHSRYRVSAADAGHAVRAVVTATDLGGATSVRSAALTIPAATSASAATPPSPPALTPPAAIAPVRNVSLSRRTIKVSYGKRVEVRGRVTGADGAPAAGATLDVGAKLRMRGATARREGSIGSASDGRFTYVAPAGASRDLKIGAATVRLLVTAAGTLRASRHGALVRFSGRLRGGHIPHGGVLVEIRAGRRVVALVRTDGHGAYRATRRATRQSFRARTRADSSWPFVSAPVGSPVSA
ncbi:hypothetical protein OM076_03555 [Solirubrobacter ginsenosidimutans]|uniref:Carboxypeptidase regulatory-like domain-containing protein n=1 Tax=Solirubrobacter ginsenosidimutans TaxID=490573 RepID=A0A9X3S0M6_9ACTN|nr:hypothetical protein [Solirubrobacter ginsenosidimutans]MDA0159331.1 hypothetical protein [Solirubrobacter ginsenosidimutans]